MSVSYITSVKIPFYPLDQNGLENPPVPAGFYCSPNVQCSARTSLGMFMFLAIINSNWAKMETNSFTHQTELAICWCNKYQNICLPCLKIILCLLSTENVHSSLLIMCVCVGVGVSQGDLGLCE